MDIRIEVVDPLRFAGSASKILTAAWKPPCLHYSDTYLAWQFSFPGSVSPRAVFAHAGSRPVGCIGVTPRQFRFAETCFPAYVLSWVAVDPVAQGQGVAAAMYAALLGSAPRDVPILAFAEPESAGERLLLAAFARASFHHHRLQPCRAFGHRARSSGDGPSTLTTTPGTYDEFLAAVSRKRDDTIIWNSPTREQWAHYQSDPRPRALAVVREGNETVIGSAMAVMVELVSSDGPHRVPMLESVCLESASPDSIRAVFSFAAARDPSVPIVVASNLSYIGESVVRGSGARALPSIFNAHLFLTSSHEFLRSAGAVNLEVI